VQKLRLWPSVPKTAAAMNEIARDVARERDRHPARAPKAAPKAATIARAAPARKQLDGAGVSSGSTGGSSSGAASHRIFAVAATAVLPFALPRVLRAAPHSSLAPTGELGLSLPDRPG